MIEFDSSIEYLLAFISAILGLSVPIMLQVIERVDQRYESTRLAERLKAESAIKSCISCMILSLISCTYAIFFKFPSPIDCWLLNNSAIIIAILSCFALILTFLLSCRVILVYYNPEKLQDRILASFRKSRFKESKESDFLDWLDLTKVLLEATDTIPALKVYDTINSEILDAIHKADLQMQLPSYVMRGITSVNEKLCLMQKRLFSINNGNQILKCLISSPSKLSDDVYRVLWNNLQLQLFYNREDWVYEYWSTAVQIYDFELEELHQDVPSFRAPDIQVKKEDVEIRLLERQRFLEFHITLCAGIFREKRYELLSDIISYIRVWPPEYPLIPSTFEQILKAFVEIENSPRFGMIVEGHYPMKGLKGIVDSVILGYVKQYLTFLYVRLFSNIGMPLNVYIEYPSTLGKLNGLNEIVNYMLNMMPSILENNDLMKLLSFQDFKEAKKQMISTLNEVKDAILQKQCDIRVKGQLSNQIIEENLHQLKDVIIKQLSPYKPFEKSSLHEKGEKFYLSGVSKYLYPNEAFQSDAGISYVNMSEAVAGASVANIQHSFASVFYRINQKRIKVNNEDVFAAIDKMNIDNTYSIVSFDVYWDYYINRNVSGFTKDGDKILYNGIQIINLYGGPTQIVSQTVFIMKTEFLPSLSYISPSLQQKQKYSLELLESEYELYSSILQLSSNTHLLDEVKNVNKSQANESSLFNVFISAQMVCAKSAHIVSIKLMYNMRDNGSRESVENIRPFEAMFQ